MSVWWVCYLSPTNPLLYLLYMIRLLIMDADGVLINGESFANILSRDFPVDKAKEKEFFTTKFQDCLVGKADLREAIAPYLPSFGWEGTVDGFLDYWFKAEHSINEDLVRDLQKMRRLGLKVVLATNQEKYRTRYMLEHMGFKDVFDKIYSSAHLGLKKPAVDFFAHVVEDAQAVKEQVLFWDDDPNNIDGALAYGINAEFYNNLASFQQIMKNKYDLIV